jgi:hypothetical protein
MMNLLSKPIHANHSKPFESAVAFRKYAQGKSQTPQIATVNFATHGKATKLKATIFSITYNAQLQKCLNKKLNATTARIQTTRSFSFMVIAIPQDHSASAAGPCGPTRDGSDR